MRNKDSRLEAIKLVVSSREISSQAELLRELSLMGFTPTQATLSRDLHRLKVAKAISPSGKYMYRLPGVSAYRRVSDTALTAVAAVAPCGRACRQHRAARHRHPRQELHARRARRSPFYRADALGHPRGDGRHRRRAKRSASCRGNSGSLRRGAPRKARFGTEGFRRKSACKERRDRGEIPLIISGLPPFSRAANI